jgi:type VI secretion system secreted protein Hcp
MIAPRTSAWIGALCLILSFVGAGRGQTTILMVVDELPGDEGVVGGPASLFAYAHNVTVPTDPRSGQQTGGRQHQPVSIMKLVNPATPALVLCLVGGQILPSVRFDFYQPDPEKAGEEIKYFTVTLENARLVSSRIEKFWSTAANQDIAYTPLQLLDFVYERIRWTYADGNVEYEDDWRIPRKASIRSTEESVGLGTSLGDRAELVVTHPSGESVTVIKGQDTEIRTLGEAFSLLPAGTYSYRLVREGKTFEGSVTVPAVRGG